tara:strand:+ start:678 stop:812 length:135 start_codon:yes stop_codon:yes gene_type:complete
MFHSVKTDSPLSKRKYIKNNITDDGSSTSLKPIATEMDYFDIKI